MGALQRRLLVRVVGDVHHPELSLATPTCPFELLDDVAVWRRRNQPVADPARELCGVRLSGRDENARQFVGEVVDACVIDRVVLAAVGLLTALPEEADHLHCFLEHLEALIRKRPTIAEHVLVEVLAGADTEEEPPGHHAADCRRGLRDYRRMNADDRRRHAGPDADALRGLGDTSERRPDEGAMPLLGDPGVVVVGDQAEREACPLGERGLSDELVRRMVFGRECESKLHGALSYRSVIWLNACAFFAVVRGNAERMDTHAAAELKSTLQGITLPSEKPLLLEYAVRQHAEPALLSALRSLPEREYESLDDVVEQLLQVQPPQNLSKSEEPHEESGQPPGGSADYLAPRPSDTGQVRDLDEIPD